MLTKTSVSAFLAITVLGIVMNVVALSLLEPELAFSLPL
jgi:hypothetical protein